MDNKIIELLSEEIRETKRLASAAWAGVEEMRKQTIEIREDVAQTKRKADAAWELVVMAQNRINRPWWKKLFGIEQ